MEQELLIKKIETLQRAKGILIGINPEKWVVGLRHDGRGNSCFLGHLDEFYRNELYNDVWKIEVELLPHLGFAAVNNGCNQHFQQPCIKDRGIAALDYCIDKLSQELEQHRTDISYDELCHLSPAEVIDLVSTNKMVEV